MCTPDEDLAHSVMDEQADDDTTFQQPAEASGEGTASRPPRPRLVMPNKPALEPRQLGETDLPVVLRIPRSDDPNSRHGDVDYNSISDETTIANASAMATELLDTQGTRRLQWATASRNPGTWLC